MQEKYDLLTYLGDLGGLYDALLIIGYIMVWGHKFAVGNDLDNYLLKQLFTRK